MTYIPSPSLCCRSTGVQDFIFISGHDTTTSGMSWTLYSLAKHPEYQRQAQEEIDHIMKNRTSGHFEWYI